MAQPAYKNDRAEEFARWRRRDHANIEAIQNLVIAQIAAETSVEMPPNVRHLVSALQGSHGGGEAAFEEFSRDYLTIGRQLQFTGTEDAVRQRVRRWVNDLLRWQRETQVELFSVVKGGNVIGTRPDGSPIHQATVFIDNLKPKADEAVQRARASELWRGNPQKGIKPHPGKALVAQVQWLRDTLPTLAPEPEPPGSAGKSSATMPASEYAQKQEKAIVKALESTADGIEERDGDADLWLRKVENLIRKMRESRKKTAPARRSWIMLSDDDDEDGERPEESAGGSNANTGITPEFPPAAEPPALGITDDTQAADESPENTDENAPQILEWALTFATMGVNVFPLKPRSKEPLGRLAKNAVHSATCDEATIRRWFEQEPGANLAIAMGGPLRLLAVDVDSRAGGNASLSDLCDAQGLDWLETFTVKTGGGGWHFIFTLPEGAEIHRGKLAPGIDIKAAGGYLVAPPSLHPNGRPYEVEKALKFAPAPAWLVEELTRQPGTAPAHVVNFQECRERLAGGPVIIEGERNERLFRVGCALWGKGEVGSAAELLQRLVEVNFERVSPPLEVAEVHKISESIAGRYPLGVPIQGGAA